MKMKTITKSGILKQRKKLGAWRRVARFYQIRPLTLLAKAKGFGIETGKRIEPTKAIKRYFPTPLAKRITHKRIEKALKLKRKVKRERTEWFKERKGRKQIPTKKGWWLTFRVQEGTTSPPFKKGEFWWSQRAHFIHAAPQKPDFESERREALERGNADVRKGWFKLVWSDVDMRTKEGKLISRGYTK